MVSSQPAMFARLSELLSTIEESVNVLRAFTQREHAQFDDDAAAYSAHVAGTLKLPFHADATVSSQAAILRIACERLAQLVTPPRHLVFEAAGSFYTTLALQIVVRSDVATLIDKESKQNGREGVSVHVLSEKSELDADLLSRLLRHLTVFGIFQEVSPNIFSNTISSSTMVDNPEFNAHLDLVMHEGQIAAPFFPELIRKRFAAYNMHASSGASEKWIPQPPSAFALYSAGQPFFPWLHSPARVDRSQNFNLAMRGMSDTEGLAFLPVDYPFGALAPDTLIVDVGGGIGSVPSLILPAVQHLRFVVQDLAPVVAQACDTAGPDMKFWIAQGKVRFEVHDCFTPQTTDKERAVFLLKSMIHNYPDSRALQILTAIRLSNPSKLLVIDRMIVPHLRTQASTAAAESTIYHKLRRHHKMGTDAMVGEPPALSQRAPTFYDLGMASLHGGRTRMLEEWQTLLASAGFRLNAIYPLRASTGQAVLEATVA